MQKWAPGTDDLNYAREHPEAMQKFKGHFGCSPDETNERMSVIGPGRSRRGVDRGIARDYGYY